MDQLGRSGCRFHSLLR